MEKRLTIIIPAYNMEAYLDRCVSSLLVDDCQLLSSLEIVIVNDGSTDKTSFIAHNYQIQYPSSIVVIDKKNGNYGSCINAGLTIAKGKYIKVLDADDWFEINSFKTFLQNLQSLDVDLIVTEFNKVNSESSVVWTSSYGQEYCHVLSPLELCKMEPMQMHALCYRTALLRDHNYQQTEGISYTDTEWSVIPMLYVQTFACLPIYLYQYLVGREGQTMDIQVAASRVDHFVTTYKKCLDWMNREAVYGIKSEYCKQKLYCCLQYFYFTILVDAHGMNADKIIEFDEYLQTEFPDFYHSLNDEIMSQTSQFHFIREWRKNGYVVKSMPWSNRCREFFRRNKLRIEWHWNHTILRKSK